MNLSPSIARSRRPYTTPARRAELLDAFERSGLSAAAFARREGIAYGTLDAWRRQRRAAGPTPLRFLQVEVTETPAPSELWIELGPCARLRLVSPAQIALAAHLLQALNPGRPC
jgi:transposase-like protein